MDTSTSTLADHQPREPGPLTRLFLKIAAVDVETLRTCPTRDWENARSVANIMIFNWLYQSALFAMISHRLWAASGQLRPDLVLAAALMATFVLSIDRYMIILSGWHLSGIQELKRGGIDIGGGPMARVKAACFLAVRILLSIGNAQLSAIFLSLFIFAADIDAHVRSAWLQANAPLIADASKPVEGEIQRATDAVKTQTARVATLTSQVTALRQSTVDPSANSPEILQAQQEVSRLAERKAKADDELRDAETFAANEGGGIKGAAANSGLPGYGARYRAAMQQVASARTRAQQLDKELETARGRLDALRTQAPSANEAIRQRAQDQLPDFEKSLEAETGKLQKLKNELATLITGREEAIGRAVEAAPNHVDPDRGFLAQVKVLEQFAKESTIIWSVILLIDVVSFGFELAAVLVKVTSYVPTSYTALLARDCYMASVRIVESMTAELKGIGARERLPVEPESNPAEKLDTAETATDVFGSASEAAAEPVKRPRGRPRKHPTPDASIKGSNGQGPLELPAEPPA
jgi:hypothetical protein